VIVRGLRALLGCAAALVLGACAGEVVVGPERAGLASLPAAVRERVDIGPSSPERVRRGGELGVTRIEVPGATRVRTEAMFSAGAARGLAVPMRLSERIYEVEAVVVSADGRSRTPVALKIDTGGSGQLSLSSEVASRVGAVVIEEFPPGRAHTGFGAKEVSLGVVGGVELTGVGGSVRLEPVQAQVDASALRYEPLLGIAALEVFGGVYFDWGRRRMVVLPRGGTPLVERERARAAAGRGWAEGAWTDGAFELRRDSLVRRGGGARTYRVEGGLRWSEVRLGDRRVIGLLDTGFSGSVFSFEPLGLGRPTGVVGASGFGRSARFDTFDAGDVVRVGGVEFAGGQVIEPREAGLGVIERGGFDVIVGLEVLTQRAMWLDFERGVVRFWVGPGVEPTMVE
jgi:predicted aspartyl protease